MKQINSIVILLSSFLLFAVQPMICKFLLPKFGGSSAVWISCMMFFQVLLLLGYILAHLVNLYYSKLKYAYLLILFIVFITTKDFIAQGNIENPEISLIILLFQNVGLPFLLLSTVSSLSQIWAKSFNVQNPYRLYALSNFGSFIALLGYPFVIEPFFSLNLQIKIWNSLLNIDCILLGFCCLKATKIKTETSSTKNNNLSAVFAYSFLSSALLLSLTNHICRDIASIPFLWLTPLAIYLLTFILCFESNKWYNLKIFAPLSLFLIFMFGDPFISGVDANIIITVVASFLLLFSVCMFCHGEITKLQNETLTSFYLSLAAGGAAAGVFVSFLSPKIFNSYLEFTLTLVVLSLLLLSKIDLKSTKLKTIILIFCIFRVSSLLDFKKGEVLYKSRNFYGLLRVIENNNLRQLFHGRISHGAELQTEKLKAVTYYRQSTGIAKAIEQKRVDKNELKIGVVGLGAGEILAHASKNDHFKFYELDPNVGEIAKDYFSFINRKDLDIEILYGDGRLLLEKDNEQNFDILYLDAFSSDSIPIHLVTKQAFDIYLKHINKNSLIVINVTNKHIDLVPVLQSLAKLFGFNIYQITDSSKAEFVNSHLILSKNELEQFEQYKISCEQCEQVWTDDKNSLISVLK